MKLESIQAQEYFNEYLDLKVDIDERVKNLNYMKNTGKLTVDEVESRQVEINIKVERLLYVLNKLNVVHGVLFEDLILLSIGVDI
ncbi:hypothetical protein AB1L07_02160 [Niallia alba]|uniref:hypothetical protein n=1 Tax=Niallia alba TaxID=2729105 RepID=UPI0039A37073